MSEANGPRSRKIPTSAAHLGYDDHEVGNLGPGHCRGRTMYTTFVDYLSTHLVVAALVASGLWFYAAYPAQ